MEITKIEYTNSSKDFVWINDDKAVIYSVTHQLIQNYLFENPN